MSPSSRWNGFIAAAAGFAALICWGPWPLGVPGEWTWVPIDGSAVSVVAMLLILFGGLGLILVVDRTAGSFARSRRVTKCAFLFGLAFVNFGWLSAVREPIDWLKTAAGRSRDPWVLYTPGTSGYFSEAREIEDTRDFIAGYEKQVAEGDYLHQGTHPPGLILLYRKLFVAHEALPGLTSLSARLMSRPVAESFDVIAETQRGGLSPIERSVLWWSGVLTQFAAAVCVIPLGLILLRCGPPESAWRIASLWAFVPAVAVFLPKSDCLYALVGLVVAASWIHAVTAPSIASSALAGFVASFGIQLSLALGPLYVGIGVGTLVWAFRSSESRWKSVAVMTAVAAAAGFVQLAPALTAGMNPISVWIGNLENHATFYDFNERSYFAWLPVNVLELVVSAGAPIFVAATCQVVAVCVRRSSNASAPASPAEQESAATSLSNTPSTLPLTITATVLVSWVALWLSGKNMGEASRLWILFTPWPILLIGLTGPISRQAWRVLAFAAVIGFAAVISRVDGFDLGGRAIGL